MTGKTRSHELQDGVHLHTDLSKRMEEIETRVDQTAPDTLPTPEEMIAYREVKRWLEGA